MGAKNSGGESRRGRIRRTPDATSPADNGSARLDGRLLEALIDERLRKGVPELLDRWMSLPMADSAGEPDVPHRSTVYRWIEENKVPRTAEDLLRLAAILDVDPLALVVMPDDDRETAFQRLVDAYNDKRHWQPPALDFLAEFLGRKVDWPPQAVARAHFGRDWCLQEFRHDPGVRANYYALIELKPLEPRWPSGPFVYHFAFRHPAHFGRRWLQYGIVVEHGARVRLNHINGHAERYEASGLDEPARVETWFGPGPAEFRVASLQAFTVDVVDAEAIAAARVRFPG